jgi:hypothetical protein
MLLLAPLFVLGGSWLGARLSTAASQLNSTVVLAERYVRQQQHPVRFGAQTAAALSLARAEEDPKALLTAAIEIRQRFQRTGRMFGAWVGLVIAAKLISLSVHRRSTEYQPDPAACLACARCFDYCPNERVRCGALLNRSVLNEPLVGGGGLTRSQPIAATPVQGTN